MQQGAGSREDIHQLVVLLMAFPHGDRDGPQLIECQTNPYLLTASSMMSKAALTCLPKRVSLLASVLTARASCNENAALCAIILIYGVYCVWLSDRCACDIGFQIAKLCTHHRGGLYLWNPSRLRVQMRCVFKCPKWLWARACCNDGLK